MLLTSSGGYIHKKVAKDVTEKSLKGCSEKEVPTRFEKVVQEVVKELSIPEPVVKKSNKLKTKSNSSSVVINDITDEEVQNKRNCSAAGLLNTLKKLRAQTVEESSTKATSNTFEADYDSEEKEDAVLGNYDLIFNDSPQRDAIVKSNVEETSIINENVT
ncbi:unnamed protein product [Lactuca virosa]|uniref:Uncharacterized protein n=1 Tax=Lactuca virosa TaxID=75947 RepID=A0AAU9LPV4_9ASTR|nr:unnamed protein product [Lactuca virosa]